MARFIIILLFFSCAFSFAQNAKENTTRKVVEEEKNALSYQEYNGSPKTEKKIVKNSQSSKTNHPVKKKVMVVKNEKALTPMEYSSLPKIEKKAIQKTNITHEPEKKSSTNVVIKNEKALTYQEYLLIPKVEKKAVVKQE